MDWIPKDMGFLIVSEGGDGLGLALRLQEEGHKVSIWIRDPALGDRGEGMVPKGETHDFQPVVLADCTGAGSILDAYRSGGLYTFGGSQIADRLETDRKYASSIFKQCGIKEPKSKEFTSWEDAKAFISSNDDSTRLVFKPEGKHSGNLPSYVSFDNDDLLGMLDRFKAIIGEANPEFVLQEFIPGVCVSSEAWFSQDHFIRPFNHTLERKQFMVGDIGPSGGCTGNVVWRCEDDDCPLCAGLLRLEDYLSEIAYNGPIDINSVVAKEDGTIYALEFTPRFGYDAFPTFLYGLYDGDFGHFLWRCSKGDGPSEMPLRNGFAAGVRISVPPWPSEKFVAEPGLPIGGLRRSDLQGFYPYEVSVVDDEYVTAGGCGIIGICIGHSEHSIEEAFEEAYKLAKKIRLPDKQYRTDLAECFTKDLKLIVKSLDAQVGAK